MDTPTPQPAPEDRASARAARARRDASFKARSIAPITARQHKLRAGAARWAAAAAALVGLRPARIVEGVVYRERSNESLRRALAPAGRGYKDYDVRFPNGARLSIRATPMRPYADLVGTLRVDVYERLARDVVPGQRVLDARSSTGAGAHLLASRVGPSGAVVALETDRESVRFARRRYPALHVAQELASIEALSGELDHAFDAVFAVDPPLQPKPETPANQGPVSRGAAPFDAHAAEHAVNYLAELWRLVAPGGRLAVAVAEAQDTPPPTLWRPPSLLPAGEIDRLLQLACNIDPADPLTVEMAQTSGRALRLITKHPPPNPNQPPAATPTDRHDPDHDPPHG
ncbi:MAG: class I SAM-dependent methyltransferase [Planctomycetota bacterium]